MSVKLIAVGVTRKSISLSICRNEAAVVELDGPVQVERPRSDHVRSGSLTDTTSEEPRNVNKTKVKRNKKKRIN